MLPIDASRHASDAIQNGRAAEAWRAALSPIWMEKFLIAGDPIPIYPGSAQPCAFPTFS